MEFFSHVDHPNKSSSSASLESSSFDSTTNPMLSDHPSKSSSFSDQLSDHTSESLNSTFLATTASDFNHRSLLSAVEKLRPALDECNLLSTSCRHRPHRTKNPTMFSGIFFQSFDACNLVYRTGNHAAAPSKVQVQ